MMSSSSSSNKSLNEMFSSSSYFSSSRSGEKILHSERVHSIILRECALILSSGEALTSTSSLVERLRTLHKFLDDKDTQSALSIQTNHQKEGTNNLLNARYVVLDTMTTILQANRSRKLEHVPIKLAASRETDEIAMRCISSSLSNLDSRRDLWKNSILRFWKVFEYIIRTLTGSNADMKSSNTNEATKMSCVDALYTLISHDEKKYEEDLFRLTTSSDNRLRIGHCISVLLSIAETYHEGSLSLRIRALDVIEMLCRALCGFEDKDDIQSGCRAFLPGISSSLCRLIQPTATASSRLMIRALLVWSTALSSSLSVRSLRRKCCDTKDDDDVQQQHEDDEVYAPFEVDEEEEAEAEACGS